MCDRRLDGEEFEFGTAGYTMNNVFVLYDRKTDSVWYPLSDKTMDAVAGPAKGTTLKFIDKPEVMRLREWVKLQPDTEVLLPPERMIKAMEARQNRQKRMAALLGEWNMATEFQGQTIAATMTLKQTDDGLKGVWQSMGREMELTDLRSNGSMIRFKRLIGEGVELSFQGTIENGKISGTWTGEFGKLECSGTKAESD